MTLGPFPAFWRAGAALQIQSILYNGNVDDVERTVEALARSVELARSAGVLSRVVLRLGDSSAIPVLSEPLIQRVRKAAYGTMLVEYDYFAANLGTAHGHNRLAAQAEGGTDFVWIRKS